MSCDLLQSKGRGTLEKVTTFVTGVFKESVK